MVGNRREGIHSRVRLLAATLARPECDSPGEVASLALSFLCSAAVAGVVKVSIPAHTYESLLFSLTVCVYIGCIGPFSAATIEPQTELTDK